MFNAVVSAVAKSLICVVSYNEIEYHVGYNTKISITRKLSFPHACYVVILMIEPIFTTFMLRYGDEGSNPSRRLSTNIVEKKSSHKIGCGLLFYVEICVFFESARQNG